jgi:plasmid stabilization system protein ParE
MRLRWTPEAFDDLESIYKYLQVNRPEFAHSTMVRIYRELNSLRRHPGLGRPHPQRAGCRELVLLPLPYVCVYRVDEYAVSLLQIRHGAQEYPGGRN